MIRLYFYIYIVTFLVLNTKEVYSKDLIDTVIIQSFKYDKYIIHLYYEPYMFDGSLFAYENVYERGKEVYYAKDFYTSYDTSWIVDLDKDGNDELVLDFQTGALMYYYNCLVIFDAQHGPKPLCFVENADLVKDVNGKTKVVSHYRMSPSIYLAGYSYSLEYKDGKLMLETDPSKSSVLSDLDVDEKSVLELIEGVDECQTGPVLTQLEAYCIQKKIIGKPEEGWQLLEKRYNCENKKEIRKLIKESVKESYNDLLQRDFSFDKRPYKKDDE